MYRRKTRIVCTIGPASSSPAVIERLMRAGMDAARLNFAHGTAAGHRRTAAAVRALSRRLDRPVALIQDLPGAKIRTGPLAREPVELVRGETWTVTGRRVRTRKGLIGVSHPAIARDLARGDRILISDGTLELRVSSRRGKDLLCRVKAGGTLGANKGVNIPGVRLRLPSLTARDRRDLALGLALGVDFVALSFVRSARDVHALRRELKRRRSPAAVLAKIERPEALANLAEIIAASDGVMVARGDLGVELPPEKVPLAQKRIIREANRAGKPVITATQMLESMTESLRPTRAEASDVANAILDGTDAVMLSEETSVGRYPVEAVMMMDRIAREAEKDIIPSPLRPSPRGRADGIPGAIAEAACMAAETLDLSAIIAFTRTGSTAALAARRRPPVPVLAFTPDPRVRRRLMLFSGVFPFPILDRGGFDRMIGRVEKVLREKKLLRRGDLVAVVSGLPLHLPGRTNALKLHVVAVPP